MLAAALPQQENAQSRPHELEEALKSFESPKAKIPYRLLNRAMTDEEHIFWPENDEEEQEGASCMQGSANQRVRQQGMWCA